MRWLRRLTRCRRGKHRDATLDLGRGLNATRDDGGRLLFQPRAYRYHHTCSDCGRTDATNRAAA